MIDDNAFQELLLIIVTQKKMGNEVKNGADLITTISLIFIYLMRDLFMELYQISNLPEMSVNSFTICLFSTYESSKYVCANLGTKLSVVKKIGNKK